VSQITPGTVAQFIGWLCDEEQQERALSDKTIRNIIGPLRACLATATREGIIAANPARDVDLPHGPRVDGDDDDEVRALTREQLGALLGAPKSRHRR
jgi:hypothetical protein